MYGDVEIIIKKSLVHVYCAISSGGHSSFSYMFEKKTNIQFTKIKKKRRTCFTQNTNLTDRLHVFIYLHFLKLYVFLYQPYCGWLKKIGSFSSQMITIYLISRKAL